MDIRRMRVWCDDCTAPLVPIAEVTIIQAFIDLLPAWRCAGGMDPVLMEGFDRAEVAAVIAHSDLTCTPHDAYRAILEMESEYREIRAANAPKR